MPLSSSAVWPRPSLMPTRHQKAIPSLTSKAWECLPLIYQFVTNDTVLVGISLPFKSANLPAPPPSTIHTNTHCNQNSTPSSTHMVQKQHRKYKISLKLDEGKKWRSCCTLSLSDLRLLMTVLRCSCDSAGVALRLAERRLSTCCFNDITSCWDWLSLKHMHISSLSKKSGPAMLLFSDNS